MLEDLAAKKERYERALEAFTARLEQDRYVLGAVLIGSLEEAIIWRREHLGLWIVESDGVSRRHASDGKKERLFRTLVEGGVNIQAEIIPRSRFRQMIEGTSRTAFTHSFFAHRRLLFAAEPSIARWFDDANSLATKDQRRELLATATWAVHCYRFARKTLELKGDSELARQEILGAAWAFAALEIVRHGEVYEEEIIYRAIELRPSFFTSIYSDLLGPLPGDQRLREALDLMLRELDERRDELFVPLLRFLGKEGGLVPLSRLADHFAYTQVYPWHLESACEWLAERGVLEKFAAPYRLTTKSQVELEEPAYLYDP